MRQRLGKVIRKINGSFYPALAKDPGYKAGDEGKG